MISIFDIRVEPNLVSPPQQLPRRKLLVIHHQSRQFRCKVVSDMKVEMNSHRNGSLGSAAVCFREPEVSFLSFASNISSAGSSVFPPWNPTPVFHSVTDFLSLALAPEVGSPCVLLNHHYVLLVYMFNCCFTLSFIFPFGLLQVLVATLRILNLPCLQDLVVE